MYKFGVRSMTLPLGDKIPALDYTVITDSGSETRNTGTLFRSGTSVLFGVPGAYTPTCNDTHLPGFILNAETLKARGVDRIVCMSVNDIFVMRAWSQSFEGSATLDFLPDGSAHFTQAMGLEFDLSAAGLGLRCKRFAALIRNGILEKISVEEAADVTVSGAETVLEWL